MTLTRLTIAAAAAAAMLAGPAAAGAPPGTTPGGARVEEVAADVYAIIHDDATDEWPHGNTGVVVTDAGVLVVDSTYLPSRARADIDLIRGITSRPVRYLVYTHWHFDHNNGGIAYREAFPGVSIVAERNTARWIELNAIWWSRQAAAEGSLKRRGIADITERLRAGKEADGKPLTPERRAALERNLPLRRNELEELSSLKVVTPDLLFDGELTIPLGGRRVEIRSRGRANSPDDTTIYLPDAKVLFTGDILVQSPLPYVGSSWPIAWIEVLKRLEEVPVAALVPGHGPVQRDHAYTRRMRSLLEAATAQVEAKIREGKTLDQIQEALDFEEVRRGFAPWNDLDDPADWKANVKTLIERTWRAVRGQG